MIDQYAVFGNPIEHSKSPAIHTDFAKSTQQSMSYTKQCVEVDDFDAAATAFFAAQGMGLNITVPFKLDAYQFAQQLTKRARQAGAVNTLIKQADGSILGDNTDGYGIMADIRDNLSWSVKGKTVIILGAGGAVRGILGPLLAEQPRHVLIANRTVDKAVKLAQAFSREGTIEGLGFEQLPHHAADIVINGTSASLAGELPPVPKAIIGPQTQCYDMMYGQQATVFMQWASQLGAKNTADGLGMLVEQAAESFRCWRAIKPETRGVINYIRENL